jgi:hypothetical protein
MAPYSGGSQLLRSTSAVAAQIIDRRHGFIQIARHHTAPKVRQPRQLLIELGRACTTWPRCRVPGANQNGV